jgi:hypothetical protein
MVQSLFHKDEMSNLRSGYEREIKEVKEEYKEELLYKEERAKDLGRTLDAIETSLEELSFAVAVQGVDRAHDLDQMMRSGLRAHESVMALLGDLEGRFPESRTRKASLEALYAEYSEALDSAVSASDRWHRQISELLVAVSEWLPAQLKEVETQIEKAKSKTRGVRQIDGARKENQPRARLEALRRKLAQLRKIEGLMKRTEGRFKGELKQSP